MTRRTHSHPQKTPRTRICPFGYSDQTLGGVNVATVESLLGRSFTGLRQNSDVPANWQNTNGHVTNYDAGRTTSYRAIQIQSTDTWTGFASGGFDTQLQTTVDNIRNSGRWSASNPFLLCFHHETSLPAYSTCGTAQNFIDAFRHFRDFLDAGGYTVFTKTGHYQGGVFKTAYVGWDRMFVGANGVGPPTAGQGIDDYDPDKGSSPAPVGTSYYDYIGSDVYNVVDSPGVLRYGTDAGTLLNPLIAAAVTRNKDFIIGEMGCGDGATTTDHTNKAAWLDSLRTSLISRGAHKPGVCRALLTTIKASVENYNVDSSAESLAAYQRLSASTYFK